ncbi:MULTISPECIES: hypothetical protein [Methylococcus]|uniref:hypothetical protein n=1 Tax=Methylococcus TaxID=413 RepID=UPI001C531B51|nr:hypothetical protein [Methylococcus capsulatus]QXP91858.1 hypothetical protein KW114_06900 [Methylococcus capsulatus]
MQTKHLMLFVARKAALSSQASKEGSTEFPKMFLLSPGADREKGNGVFFDIAVAVKADKNAGAGAKASILSVVEIEVGGKQTSTSEQTSRITFAININQWHG